MKVLISGASGLIGKPLQDALKIAGYKVVCLVRSSRPVSSDAVVWDPTKGRIDAASLENFDAVIHLAGENIAAGRWTEERKKRILSSRVESTKTLVNSLFRLTHPPKMFICASAIGYYGNRFDEVCTEKSSSGSGFLAEVCRQWEGAAVQAEKAGIRTVLLRTGIVLSPDGGALGRMLLPFKLALGGRLGSGEQYMSWIAIDDMIGAILFILNHENVSGPVNAVAPNPVTNAEFTRILGKVLNRPAILPVPPFALRLLVGRELTDEVLLGSTRAAPEKLTDCGFTFAYPRLEQAFNKLLKG